MKNFKIPSIPQTTNKCIRFPNNVIEDVENAIRGKNCTFSAFVIEAVKVALSNLDKDKAGSITGTYGLFRDLTVPFGVAIFVPLFTNGITNYMSSETNIITSAEAAVKSIHVLSIVEILMVTAGIILVQFLPKIHEKIKERKY